MNEACASEEGDDEKETLFLLLSHPQPPSREIEPISQVSSSSCLVVPILRSPLRLSISIFYIRYHQLLCSDDVMTIPNFHTRRQKKMLFLPNADWIRIRYPSSHDKSSVVVGLPSRR